jgi:hypothetical protein
MGSNAIDTEHHAIACPHFRDGGEIPVCHPDVGPVEGDSRAADIECTEHDTITGAQFADIEAKPVGHPDIGAIEGDPLRKRSN